jgi:hypothetical protein
MTRYLLTDIADFSGSHLRVLYLTSRLPIPPLVKGDTLRDFYIIKELASRGHKVTLVSFFRKNETNDPNLEILKKYCQEIKLIKFDLKKQSLNLAKGIYGLTPFQILLYRSKAFQKEVDSLLFQFSSSNWPSKPFNDYSSCLNLIIETRMHFLSHR